MGLKIDGLTSVIVCSGMILFEKKLMYKLVMDAMKLVVDGNWTCCGSFCLFNYEVIEVFDVHAPFEHHQF